VLAQERGGTMPARNKKVQLPPPGAMPRGCEGLQCFAVNMPDLLSPLRRSPKMMRPSPARISSHATHENTRASVGPNVVPLSWRLSDVVKRPPSPGPLSSNAGTDTGGARAACAAQGARHGHIADACRMWGISRHGRLRPATLNASGDHRRLRRPLEIVSGRQKCSQPGAIRSPCMPTPPRASSARTTSHGDVSGSRQSLSRLAAQ